MVGPRVCRLMNTGKVRVCLPCDDRRCKLPSLKSLDTILPRNVNAHHTDLRSAQMVANENKIA